MPQYRGGHPVTLCKQGYHSSDVRNIPWLCDGNFHKQGKVVAQVAPQAAFVDQLYADTPPTDD